MIDRHLNLTGKIVLLVALMGAVSAIINAYSTHRLHKLGEEYRYLLTQQATIARETGHVTQALGNASTQIYGILVAQSEEVMELNSIRIHTQQLHLEHSLQRLYALLPGDDFLLDTILVESRHAFIVGQRTVQAARAWRGDRALLIVQNSFSPAMDQLYNSVNALRDQAHHVLKASTNDIAVRTQHTTLITALSGWCALVLIGALAAWVATRHVSQPISRLTRSMQRMSHKDYTGTIGDQRRTDEIGTMARTLQGFNTALQQAEVLEQEMRKHHTHQLLTAQLLELTSALPGAVFQINVVAGQNIHLKFASPQWVTLMGLDPISQPSDTASAIYMLRTHATDAMAVANMHFARCAQTLESVDFDTAIDMLDGVTRWIKTRANPKLEADGSVTFNGVWLDVSKEVLQARALEKSKRHAEQMAHEKSALQASISHEIRTPLNAILGLTQLLLKSEHYPAQKAQLHSVLRAGQHLRGIVNEVLDFSKIDAGQLKLESTDFSLSDILNDVLMMCRESAAEKQLTLSHRVSHDVPDALRGDPHRIAQILLNYVNNAIKFTEHGHIDISVRLAADSTLHRIVLHVSVQDTGVGIPSDRIALLFDAFQQADSSITRRYGGTGLGLTISRSLAQLMGGDAGVHSQLGVGSTFWFTALLEPARSPVTSKALPAPTPAPSHWAALHVLVVDDNPLNRTVAEGLLHSVGLQVETAEDGAQALALLQARTASHFACIFMDVQMPVMDGLSSTEALRRLPGLADVPVVAMTAHTGLDDIERTRAAGMNDHLSKPLMENALWQALRRWLPRANSSHHEAPPTAPPMAPALLPASLQAVAATTLPPSTATSPPDATATLPPIFEASAVNNLASFFPAAKLSTLVEQFCTDTLERSERLHHMATIQDWDGMRAEAHKLAGTAATFGLLQLGHWASSLSPVLREADPSQARPMAQQLLDSATHGVAALRNHRPITQHED